MHKSFMTATILKKNIFLNKNYHLPLKKRNLSLIILIIFNNNNFLIGYDNRYNIMVLILLLLFLGRSTTT